MDFFLEKMGVSEALAEGQGIRSVASDTGWLTAFQCMPGVTVLLGGRVVMSASHASCRLHVTPFQNTYTHARVHTHVHTHARMGSTLKQRNSFDTPFN